MIKQDTRRVWMLIAATGSTALLLLLLSVQLLGVTFDYTLQVVAVGGAILGVVSGVLGSFAVLRQQSLLGDALSHAALPGVALAFLIAGRNPVSLLIGAGIAGWLGVQFISAVTHTTRIKHDTAMAMALAAFFAIGIALLSYIQGLPDASQAGLDKFIFGQAAAIRISDVQLISGVGLLAFVVLALLWKEFKLITFNREFAAANGFNVRLLDGILSLLVVVAIVLGLQLAGVILMVGMLIAPGVAARQWTPRLESMIVLAGVFGGFAGGVGATLSAVDVGLPTGPLIIVVASIVVALSMLFAPQRGLIWARMKQREDRRRFSATHILRDLYSHARQHGNLSEPMAEQTLLNVRGNVARDGLAQLQRQQFIKRENGGWQLTASGIEAAQKDARNQELWQLYRRHSESLNLPVVPEDRERPIENMLSHDAIQRLEALMKKGAPA